MRAVMNEPWANEPGQIHEQPHFLLHKSTFSLIPPCEFHKREWPNAVQTAKCVIWLKHARLSFVSLSKEIIKWHYTFESILDTQRCKILQLSESEVIVLGKLFACNFSFLPPQLIAEFWYMLCSFILQLVILLWPWERVCSLGNTDSTEHYWLWPHYQYQHKPRLSLKVCAFHSLQEQAFMCLDTKDTVDLFDATTANEMWGAELWRMTIHNMY